MRGLDHNSEDLGLCVLMDYQVMEKQSNLNNINPCMGVIILNCGLNFVPLILVHVFLRSDLILTKLVLVERSDFILKNK